MLNEAYKYYPKHLSPFDQCYDNAMETCRLLNLLEVSIKINREKVKILQDIINQQTGLIAIDARGENNFPCEYLTMYSKENSVQRKIHIWVSNIIPFHLIECFEFVGMSIGQQGFVITESNFKPKLSIITSSVFNTSLFPPHLESEIVPFVKTQNSNNTFATFRDVFFSNYIANY